MTRESGFMNIGQPDVDHISVHFHKSKQCPDAIAVVNFGFSVNMHVHSAELAREGVVAFVKACRILDPDGGVNELLISLLTKPVVPGLAQEPEQEAVAGAIPTNDLSGSGSLPSGYSSPDLSRG
jgi:hypothetical protein